MRFIIEPNSYIETRPQLHNDLLKSWEIDFMHTINVSLVFATEQKQWIHEAQVARGTSAQELIESSEFMAKVETLSAVKLELLDIGVFSQKIALDYLLEEGDRVELYRPLTADPKEVRRQLALLGKTIGNTSKGKT
jgi:putative ubiquitin-RnfH superfamily antitoxin RatB of RatAB toxin-antitoxin module